MINQRNIKSICEKFKIDSQVDIITQLESGHINDTYLINTVSGKKYVLQQINSKVFKNTEDIISNKVLVTKHLQNSNSKYMIIEFIKAHTNDSFYIDSDSNYWNLMNYIPESTTHSIATNIQLVEEAGKLYGDFIFHTSNLNPDKLICIIPDFHSIPFRYKQFEDALAKTEKNKRTRVKNEIEFVINCKKEMHELSDLIHKNKLPIRVTHNDAKLSNILFDKNNKGLSVIDLDTVMAGITAFDFGDSIRSICSTTKEDDINLNSTEINLDFYEAYCKGFATSTNNILNISEIKSLPLGAKTITFIMGLRFLTDYLNDNIYYKTTYKAQNLDRAKNQFQLVKSIQENYQSIVDITFNIFN